jgi:hypothetical protein
MARVFRITPATFRNADVGCLGAALLVLLTAGGVFGLVAMVWWMVANGPQ